MSIHKKLALTMNWKSAPSPLELLVAERTLRLCSVSGATDFYVMVWRGATKTAMYDRFNDCVINSDVEEGDLEYLENFLYKHLTKE